MAKPLSKLFQIDVTRVTDPFPLLMLVKNRWNSTYGSPTLKRSSRIQNSVDTLSIVAVTPAHQLKFAWITTFYKPKCWHCGTIMSRPTMTE